MTELVPRPVPGREIATTGDGRDITRPYVGGMLLTTDPILRQRGGGDLRIYEQVLLDPQVKACFEQRRNAVVSCEWQVDPASDRRVDKKAAEHLRLQLQRIGWDRVTDRMLYSVWYGYSVAELLWDVQDGLLGWKAIKARNRRRFRFNADNELRLLTPTKPYDGEPAPGPYFWHIATGADHDDEPYGMGLGSWCYWPALFKRNGIAFWMTYLEKFAMPTAIGKYPQGSTEAQIEKLMQALKAIRTDSGVGLPSEMIIELLEATRAGTSDYKTLHDTMDATIAKAILGQTMTTEDGSSRAQAEVHMDVRQDIVKADADLVCESLNLGPVQWLTMFNFPDAEPPRVFRVVEEPEDAGTAAERDAKVMGLGFKPNPIYVRERYGDHWEQATPNPAPAVAPVPLPDDPAFAEPAMVARLRQTAQDRLDVLYAAGTGQGEQYQQYVGPRVRELQVALDEAPSLEQFRERLIEMTNAEPNPEFIQAVTRGGFAAWLLGRSSPEE